jgi:hypothetical protein
MNDNPEGPYCAVNKCEYLATHQFQCEVIKSHFTMTCDYHSDRGSLDHMQVCDYGLRCTPIGGEIKTTD